MMIISRAVSGHRNIDIVVPVGGDVRRFCTMTEPWFDVGIGVPEEVGTGVADGVREYGTGVGVADDDEEVTIDDVVAGVVVVESANPESNSRFSSSAALQKRWKGWKVSAASVMETRSVANKKNHNHSHSHGHLSVSDVRGMRDSLGLRLQHTHQEVLLVLVLRRGDLLHQGPAP